MIAILTRLPSAWVRIKIKMMLMIIVSSNNYMYTMLIQFYGGCSCRFLVLSRLLRARSKSLAESQTLQLTRSFWRTFQGHKKINVVSLTTTSVKQMTQSHWKISSRTRQGRYAVLCQTQLTFATTVKTAWDIIIILISSSADCCIHCQHGDDLHM